MKTRDEIIKNQIQFRDEIVKNLKVEYKSLKEELKKIDSKHPEIIAAKEKLMEKTKMVNIVEEIEKLFISWKNTTPNFVAWWDEENQQVQKIKYDENNIKMS
jgi:hypothetical protein